VDRAIDKWGSLENIQLQKDLRKSREKQEHAGLSRVCSSVVYHVIGKKIKQLLPKFDSSVYL